MNLIWSSSPIEAAEIIAKLAAGESVVLAIPRVFDNEPGAEDKQSVFVSLTPRMIETNGLRTALVAL